MLAKLVKQISIPLLLIAITSCGIKKYTRQQDEIRSGINLVSAMEISFDQFFKLWTKNNRITKKGDNLTLLYTDESYSYFSKPKITLFKQKNIFYKIENKLLASFPNNNEIYPEDLSSYMWKNVIPEEEKNLYRELTTNKAYVYRAECTLYKNKLVQSYLFKEGHIYLQSKWETNCSGLKHLNGKTYCIKMNPITMEIEQIVASNK